MSKAAKEILSGAALETAIGLGFQTGAGVYGCKQMEDEVEKKKCIADTLKQKNVTGHDIAEMAFGGIGGELVERAILKGMPAAGKISRKLAKEAMEKAAKKTAVKVTAKVSQKVAAKVGATVGAAIAKKIAKDIAKKLMLKAIAKGVARFAAKTASKASMGPVGWALMGVDALSLGLDLWDPAGWGASMTQKEVDDTRTAYLDMNKEAWAKAEVIGYNDGKTYTGATLPPDQGGPMTFPEVFYPDYPKTNPDYDEKNPDPDISYYEDPEIYNEIQELTIKYLLEAGFDHAAYNKFLEEQGVDVAVAGLWPEFLRDEDWLFIDDKDAEEYAVRYAEYLLDNNYDVSGIDPDVIVMATDKKNGEPLTIGDDVTTTLPVVDKEPEEEEIEEEEKEGKKKKKQEPGTNIMLFAGISFVAIITIAIIFLLMQK